MNILTQVLPETVIVDGAECVINTDFRAALRSILAFEDDSLTRQEKTIVMLRNLYPTMPENADAAIQQATIFLNGGQEDAKEEDSPMRLFSFAKDANFIFAAFKQTHGVDLQTAKLHWWTFLALFMDLGGETTFSGLVALRKRLKNGKATKEEIEMAQEMGDLIEVPEPDTRSPEERQLEDEFMRLVGAK